MDIDITTVGLITVVTLAGRIDGKTAPQVQQSIWPLIQPGHALILDLTGLTYMSSAGLRVLAMTRQHASSHDAKLVLAGLSEAIRDTMSITGFLPLFTTYPTVEAALASHQ